MKLETQMLWLSIVSKWIQESCILCMDIAPCAGLVTTLLFCALTFAFIVWNFFFVSQLSIPVQILIWENYQHQVAIAIYAILFLNLKYQYYYMYFHPIRIAFTDKLQKLQRQALSIWLPREVTVWLARPRAFHRENSAWNTVPAYFFSEICTRDPKEKDKN